MTVLMKLIMLQDRQQMLLRATLFGVEVTNTYTMRLFDTVHQLRVLPWHVACCLDTPAQSSTSPVATTTGPQQ
jgi:hypothetical protein